MFNKYKTYLFVVVLCCNFLSCFADGPGCYIGGTYGPGFYITDTGTDHSGGNVYANSFPLNTSSSCPRVATFGSPGATCYVYLSGDYRAGLEYTYSPSDCSIDDCILLLFVLAGLLGYCLIMKKSRLVEDF